MIREQTRAADFSSSFLVDQIVFENMTRVRRADYFSSRLFLHSAEYKPESYK